MKNSFTALFLAALLALSCGCAAKPAQEETPAQSELPPTQTITPSAPTSAESPYTCGTFTLGEDGYVGADARPLDAPTAALIDRAKTAFAAGHCPDYDFSTITITSEYDTIGHCSEHILQLDCQPQPIRASFRSDNGNLVNLTGDIVSAGEHAQYGVNDVDALLTVAQDYYAALDVPQGYALTGWQMDGSGNDWQVEFTRSVDIAVPGYDAPIYNEGEMVRMRLAGDDGRLLSLHVFDAPLDLEAAKKQTPMGQEAALENVTLDKSHLRERAVGCHTTEDGTARLCWSFVFDESKPEDLGVCDIRTYYVDLFTGEILHTAVCG